MATAPGPWGAVHYRVVSSPVKDAEGRVTAVIEVVEDVSPHVRNADELLHAHELQQALNGMLRISLEPGGLPEKLGRLLDEVLSVPWFEVQKRAAVFLAEEGGLTMAAQRNIPEPQQRSCSRVLAGQCLCGMAFSEGRLIISQGFEERHDRASDGIEPHGHICAPLRSEGAVVGVLNLYTKAGAISDKRQLAFVEAAAGVFAGCVRKAMTEKELLQAQKVEVIGRLTGGVAHDFSNILTVILGNTHLLLEGLKADDPLVEFVQGIRRSVWFASSLTRQLLAFSRKQAPRLRCMDLNAVVLETQKMLRRLLSESIAIELRLHPSLWPVTADLAQMEQVLLNLAVNARDAMPQGGRLVIATENVTAGLGGEPSVRLSVSDTGVGMDEGVRRRLFEPFFTTKAPGMGTGLGLATVMSIVQQSHADISVESLPGQGAAFHILLPRSPGGTGSLLPGSVPAEAPGGTEGVIVLEDHAELRSIIVQVLRDKGYRVRGASNAEEAIALGRAYPREADLLLADVVLPGKGGKEVGDWFKEHSPATRIIFMSGHMADAVDSGGVLRDSQFLEKPFSPETLLAALRSALDSPAGGA
jgi:signal transduction histidine kinase/CheY-like chemotaxis protein